MAISQAPEGIVAYSWSGTTWYPSGYIPGHGAPIINPPSIQGSGILVGPNAWIDVEVNDIGTTHINTEKLVLTDEYIETLDLISEGVIEGPLTGVWIFTGILGNTGWNNAWFSGNQVPSGLTQYAWLNSVFWNELPVMDNGGNFNFQNVDLSYTLGLPNGDILQELENQEETSRAIGTRLYGGFVNSQTFRILNPNCKGVIVNVKIPGMSNTDSSNGNIYRTLIQWQIAYRPVFTVENLVTSFSQPIQAFVYGKISTAGGYVQSTEIDFNLTSFIVSSLSPQYQNQTINDSYGFLNDPDFVGWEIQIVRLTPESTSALLVNATYIDSITELYGSQLTYPNSAIIRQTFNAEFFTEIPNRGFLCNLLKIQIPANYNPIMRTYSTSGYGTTNGYWNGTMASGKAWTNNPAWCFYDLITNPRYGLEKFVDNIDVYKFDLYNIAQYCDQLVADGYGGLEPRFTCNVWLAQKQEAYKVLNDMASIFRGMIYYFNGNLNAVQDSPKTPRISFTNANVENGDFNYSSTSKKTRQSIAVIRYNDPLNFYKPAIEYVEDMDAIRRYGVRELPITAFGCTSRGQAIRLGKWALYSNNIETETITFTAGLEANLLRCGDIFEVADYNRKLKRYGGRVLQLNNIGNIGNGFTGANIILDSNIDLESGIQYAISFITPSFYYDPSQVTGLTSNDYSNIYKSFVQKFYFSGDATYQSGNYTVLNLITGLDNINYNISGNPVWSVEIGPNSLNYTGSFYTVNSEVSLINSISNTMPSDYYRVINIKETDIGKYQIIGLLYWPDKFGMIDSGLYFEQNQTYGIGAIQNIPASPRNLQLYGYRISNNQSIVNYQFIVDNYSYITNYKVFADTGFFENSPNVPSNNFLIATLPSNVINANASFMQSGIYTFRIYSYNSAGGIFSTGYAGGAISLSSNLPITDVTIGGLTII